MNDPKTFYRELDALLANIGKNINGENFLSHIITELEQKFGAELQIKNGCIYEQRNKKFILVFPQERSQWTKKIDVDSPSIQHVLEHGSFIYDNQELGRVFGVAHGSDIQTPAAISISSPERQWVIVFGMQNGWMREEITLFLNAVRTAINYRLYSEIIGGGLQQAVRIQESLLPRKSPEFEGYQIYGRSIPADLVGGDFFEYFEYDEGSFGISIGDASGHGLPAALLVRDVVIGLRMGLASEYKSVYTIKKLNKVIQQSTYATNFVSLFFGEFEKGGHLFYVNAGHPAPFLVSGNGISELGPTGIVLGYLKDIELQRSYIQMDPDSVLVLYTDGIIERENSGEEEFGLERLKELVKQHRSQNPKDIVDRIFKEVYKYGNFINWSDDATLVVIKRCQQKESA